MAEDRIKVNCPKDPAVLYLVTISYFERHLKYNAFTDKLERNNNFPARGRNCYHTGKLTLIFLWRKPWLVSGKPCSSERWVMQLLVGVEVTVQLYQWPHCIRSSTFSSKENILVSPSRNPHYDNTTSHSMTQCALRSWQLATDVTCLQLMTQIRGYQPAALRCVCAARASLRIDNITSMLHILRKNSYLAQENALC